MVKVKIEDFLIVVSILCVGKHYVGKLVLKACLFVWFPFKNKRL